jgi:hypothetical protein
MAKINGHNVSDGSPSSNTTANASQPPPLLEKPGDQIPPNQAAPRKATGPRTAQGKKRARFNALRHGIFSQVIVLPGESRREYDTLVKELSEGLSPEGRLEKLIIEKMAMITWRHRRLLQAEAAEIELGMDFMEWDLRMRQSQDAEVAKRTLVREFKTFVDKPGLILEMQNPEILEYCVRLLLELQNGIKSRGFSETRDCSILAIIYGGDLDLHGTFRDFYLSWLNISRVPEEERQCKGYATPEQCKERVSSAIDAEIRGLRNYREGQAIMESERAKLEVLRRKVPVSERLERLLRFEASLERGFERALNQYERVQRLRRGQPVAPRIDVNIST